jgi:class I fructose-bisphosphate aldolase
MTDINTILGEEADLLLNHQCKTSTRDQLHQPGPGYVDRVMSQSDRGPVSDA